MNQYDINPDEITGKIVGATFGDSNPQIATAVIVDENVGMYDFLTVEDTLIQISDMTIKSTITEDDAREIARGNAVDRKVDAIAH